MATRNIGQLLKANKHRSGRRLTSVCLRVQHRSGFLGADADGTLCKSWIVLPQIEASPRANIPAGRIRPTGTRGLRIQWTMANARICPQHTGMQIS